MAAQVTITEPARNIVQISIVANNVAITETVNTVLVSATNSTTGTSALGSDLAITNTIGDAIAGNTYVSGTTLEEIISDLVAPFLEPTFLSVSWSATGTHQADGEKLLVECGLAASVSSLSITWSNPENFNDSTNLVITDTSAVPSAVLVSQNITDYGALSVPHVQSASYVIPVLTTPVLRNVSIATAYLGNDGIGASVALTKVVQIAHRHRVYVITSTSSTISGVQALLTGAASTVLSTLAVDPTAANQSLPVACTASTGNASNFTWILIPLSASLGEVAAEVNSKGVADYTDSWVLEDNSGSGHTLTVGTASPAYKAYRSIQSGAFDSDITLNIEILH